MIVQFFKGDDVKNVGVVKLNLGEAVDSVEPVVRRHLVAKLKPEYEPYVEVMLKSKLVAGSSTDTLSQMSDVLSVDSGVDSEFDFEDFGDDNQPEKNRRPGRKPA